MQGKIYLFWKKNLVMNEQASVQYFLLDGSLKWEKMILQSIFHFFQDVNV